jgi:hypothetical protein
LGSCGAGDSPAGSTAPMLYRLQASRLHHNYCCIHATESRIHAPTAAPVCCGGINGDN